MSKIVSFSPGHFARKKPRPLTPLMVITLTAAYAKQKQGIPFGPTDIRGSFASLITRGLVVRKPGKKNEPVKTWMVTNEAIEILKQMGITT